MKFLNTLNKIGDILLEEDDSTIDWKSDTTLRKSFHTLLLITLIAISFRSLFTSLFMDSLVNSENMTAFRRISLIVLTSLMIVNLMHLTYSYFKFTIINNNRIRFSNILYFYIFSIFIFTYLYENCYYYNSNLFQYDSSLITPTELYQNFPLKEKILTKVDFLLFSGFQGVGGASNSIRSNSKIISLISWVQSIYVLSLIVLFIASFVNQNVGEKKNISNK